MQFKAKLKDPRQKNLAKRVYARDGYRCTFNCNVDGIPLVAHHRVYYMDNKEFIEPWDYLVEDLDTLCSWCHSSLHGDFGTT